MASTLPDELIKLFEGEAISSASATPWDSIKLQHDTIKDSRTHFVRSVGRRAIEEHGYVITGLREHDDYLEVWFDEISLDVSASDESWVQ